MIDIPTPPWVTEAYDLTHRTGQERREQAAAECAVHGHPEPIEVTTFADPAPRLRCPRCGTTIEETP